MKLLISWVAFNNDFKDGEVDKNNSPNYIIHRDFFEGYDKHIIFSAAMEDDTKLNYLINTIRNDFTNHNVSGEYMGITDVIDLDEIKTKVESKLLEFSNDDIDIFFSPGTSIMQVSWYICHTSLGLRTRLLQLRPALKSKTKKPELLEIKTEQSSVPFTAILKEKNVQIKGGFISETEDYLITNSIKSVYERAYKIAQTDKVTTLIYGESGTGKEHVAKYIHENSNRRKQPFLPLNCSAFQDSLLESRLFGHLKGAFTDATEDRKGLFELANGGTIFLDEIGDITPYMQQSLLRVMQEKEITPVGGKTKKVNVRVIAATNKNLVKLCKEGKFRWDLYYRLAITELELPTLRKRGIDEIEKLFNFFLRTKKSELKKRKILKISKEAKTLFLKYSFPGNVRELENIIESFYVFSDNEINISDLPQKFNIVSEEESFKWQDVEKQHIKKILNHYKGNQRQACKALGYGSINTLSKKIKKYKIVMN